MSGIFFIYITDSCRALAEGSWKHISGVPDKRHGLPVMTADVYYCMYISITATLQVVFSLHLVACCQLPQTIVWILTLVYIEHEMCLYQRFSIPVLAPPRSAYFVCYSYRFRCLFYSNVSALRSGHHTIFHHDSSSKRTYIFHSKCIEVCKTWIKIVYIYRGIWCHTRPCVKTLRSANPWMNVPEIK